METKTVNNIRECNSLDNFIELFDEAKLGCDAIYCNGRKIDKRKSKRLAESFEDIFDNNVTVKYLFHNRSLFIGTGNYY